MGTKIQNCARSRENLSPGFATSLRYANLHILAIKNIKSVHVASLAIILSRERIKTALTLQMRRLVCAFVVTMHHN